MVRCGCRWASRSWGRGLGYVVTGVAPWTWGSSMPRIALAASGPARFPGWSARPAGPLLILIGNAITPGKGYREGPFVSQAELRELLDQAGADAVIEDEERQMLHSVFELGDTLVREVMVPRTEMVWIERTKRFRQALSLGLRSGFSSIPVIGENLDDVVGVVYPKGRTAHLRTPELGTQRARRHGDARGALRAGQQARG